MLQDSRILDDYLNEFSRYIDNMSSLIYFVWFFWIKWLSVWQLVCYAVLKFAWQSLATCLPSSLSN